MPVSGGSYGGGSYGGSYGGGPQSSMIELNQPSQTAMMGGYYG
jgi:hypothetical protein